MNNRFKFRVWTGSTMEYNVVVGRLGSFYALQDPNDSASLNPTSKYPDNCAVIQYTGLQDKNGAEIYEGDILNQILDSKPCYYIVEWGNRPDYCGFVLRPLMKRDGTFRMTVHDFKIYLAEGFEIIGNIYENPELLKSYERN